MKTTKRAVAQKKFDALDVSKKSETAVNAVKLIISGDATEITFMNKSLFEKSRNILHVKELLSPLGIEYNFKGDSLTILTKIKE